MPDTDTIAAIATAPGQGGVGIVRVSGPAVEHIAQKLLGTIPPVRHAYYAKFHDSDGDVIDQGIALYFSAPASFTGEDVLELQGHGGPVVLDRLLQQVLRLGARAARAGEFSERAFLNDKIDLVQAEAIADLIAAESEQAAAAAMHSLQGEFSSNIQQLLDQLVNLRMHVESTLDFPEEEIDFLGDDAIAGKLDAVIKQLDVIHRNSVTGRVLNEGLQVVISGKPNAGKSSLLNLLAGHDSAIVSDIPGTTRDVLRETIRIQGVPIHIIDTAGLRESTDEIEQEGVRRARVAVEQADIVLRVVDVSTEASELPQQANQIVVLNKMDLLPPQQKLECIHEDVVAISARTGEGLKSLQQAILRKGGYQQPAEQNTGLYSARRRHLQALDKTAMHLKQAYTALHDEQAGEVMAEELRLAQNALAEITGTFSSDDLLGKIFSEFCIGK